MEYSYTVIQKHFLRRRRFRSVGRIYSAYFKSNYNNNNQRATISFGLLARHHSTLGSKRRFIYRMLCKAFRTKTDAELRARLDEFFSSRNGLISTKEVLKILLNVGKKL
ncbi:hypothetical protein TNIN_89971 [Trichonephila inaurata madagascariensis]|uniref:Uncharacterized protein n=1 Tax=Trichonephila inaurata madagascariensis TaxID=2747483 RepID=A0A8X6XL46_9ARAC|nr:hypothetical protein TNIN_89971 [Trichonephila inaurata madagascariensis]